MEELLCELSGTEAAVVVNNNAAAVFLTLNTFAAGKGIVSRASWSESAAPSGSRGDVRQRCPPGQWAPPYDLPARLQAVVTAETAALLKVHTSNYNILGFTASVSAAELAALGKARGILAIEDLGSGVFLDLTRYGLPAEPRVQDSIAAGMDLVTFSGDKLLGGPQAGIVVGRRELIDRLRRNQLARALRVDRLNLAALEATLRLYLDEEQAVAELPIWRALTARPEHLKERAQALARRLEAVFGPGRVELWAGSSRVGGGACRRRICPPT